jgi:hypothetical protein
VSARPVLITVQRYHEHIKSQAAKWVGDMICINVKKRVYIVKINQKEHHYVYLEATSLRKAKQIARKTYGNGVKVWI